jgi:hypothetical protein
MLTRRLADQHISLQRLTDYLLVIDVVLVFIIKIKREC